ECFTLTQPALLAIEVYNVIHVDCYGNANGSIDIMPFGGTTPYTFAWSNGEVTEDLSNLGPGTYCVTVTDANLCIATACIDITEPPLLTLVGSVTNIVCFGQQSGAIDITVGGGVTPYTYAWDNGATDEDLSGLLAGTYCVTVTDANNCEILDCYTINEPPLLELAVDVHNLLCVDGNQGWINLTITGGVAPYDIIWSNSETTEDIDSLNLGTYCVTVTDDYGCVATICGTVEQPDYPLAALYITGENVDCYAADNGWFEVMATGGAAPYQYSLDYAPFSNFTNSPMIYTNLTPGFHLLTIGDSNNCEILYEVEITEPDTLELTFDWEDIYCFGETTGWIDMTITGGTLYQYFQSCNCDTSCFEILWSNGATTEDISGLSAGTYTVTVTDCNGCVATGSVTITEPPAIVLTYTKIDLNCYGDASGEIDITVTGGTPAYTYLWNTGATTQDLSGLSGGFYTVTVTDANDCVAMVTVMITEPAPTQLDFDVTDIMCTGVNDGAIDLLMQDSVCLSYTWSNGATTQDIYNLAAGWYWVTVVDCNGCVAIDSACVYAPNNELEIGYMVHDVLCYGGNTGWIDISAIGGTMPYVGIQWTGVIETDCCGLDTVVLDSIQLWGLGQTTDVIENLEAGTYYVTLTDAYGCEAYATIVVEQPLCPVHIANELITDVDMGIMGAIDIYVCCGTFPYSYYWEYEGDYFATSEDLEYLMSGIYTVTVTDANGCITTGSFVVNSNVYPPWTSGISESSHTIYIPVSAVAGLTIGDYVGVFYDSLGTFACGGFVKWEGVATTLAAWGDDGIDPSDETGFVDDEIFTWVIWDAGTGTEFAADPTYDLGLSWPSDSTYEVNGISGLLSLTIGSVLDAQDIDLMAGWNLISTYIDPFQDSLQYVFDPVMSELIIVKDGNGQVYWPLWNVNVIGTLTIGEGYKVKMTSAEILTIGGAVIAPEATPVSIPAEWSILGYLRTSPASIETLLSNIVSDVIIVKNESGYVYWPSMFNINTIGNMVPGEGYHIKMANAAVLTYAANGMITKSGVSNVDTYYFKNPVNTGSNMTIGIPQSAWQTNPQIGDEVAILNTAGEVLGASVYNGAMSVCVWGDDEVTSNTEGIADGGTFTLAIWSKVSENVQTLRVVSWTEGNNVYAENAISIVGKFAETSFDGLSYALYQNMPNPFSASTQIRFQVPNDTYVHIGVYNLLGELIEEVVGADIQAGEHTVNFDANKLAAGSYLYKIITDDYSATKQMNVTR
ncbi:MAG: T9SS type A sorting domain-containing protein, partial [Bacteroidota bacterium]|nr:T9SS type A sorting domain-containing protein [Bacteroidota bacterium]